MKNKSAAWGKKGQTLVEYALILSLISLILVATLTLFGDVLINFYNQVTDSLGNVT
jgi:Flp pilus assembly pilin Flp